MSALDISAKENADPSRGGSKRKSDAMMMDAPHGTAQQVQQPPAKKKAEPAPKAATSAASKSTGPIAKTSSTLAGSKHTAAAAARSGRAITASSVSAATAKKAALAITAPAVGGKRPAWDLKGRLEDMESKHQKMVEQLRGNSTNLQQLMSQLNERDRDLNQLSDTKRALVENLQSQQLKFERAANEQQRLLDALAHVKRDHQQEMDTAHAKIRSLELDLEQARSRIRLLSDDVERIKLALESTQEQLRQTESTLSSTKAGLQTSQQKNDEKAKKIDDLLLKVASLEDNVRHLENKTREDERIRRKLHNTIQELKGNIRVFCRVRPVSAREADDSFACPFQFSGTDDRSLEVVVPAEKTALGKQAQGKKWQFSFDKMFPPGVSQLDVFTEVSQLVQSSLDGYNTCIFAYGQTGSGKTYTMEGPVDADAQSKGVIPRAVEQVFATAKELEESGWQFDMEVNFVEIYNETIQDLLLATAASSVEHKIVHENGITTVTGITICRVLAPSQVYELLRRATKNRSTGATKMNERSSRSHSVFQLRIKGRNSITGEDVKGLLNLIDLAGSERLDQSGATGDRLTETKNINKSLSTLAKVIFALANKESHIPYRDSKLTYLLQNSLGGNSKTLMFVNVSPLDRDLNETLNSLRFATAVNACEIGTAKKQGTKKIEL